jgi:hypothetical protein
MGVNDCIKTIEKKLQVVQCNNREMVLFASHQLEGPASDWWDAYVDAHEEPDSINWQGFSIAFHLHQTTHFTQLSRYAPGDVDIDEKKQDYFLNGLNDGLAYTLEARDLKNFQDMVNKALVLENHHGAMEQKRKQERQH